MSKNIRVIKDAENPETPAVLAASIIKISKAFGELQKEGLTPKAIVTLLMGMDGMSKVSKPDIYLVLENLPKLASYYVRKPAEKRTT